MKAGHTHPESKKRVKAPKRGADGPTASSPLRDVGMLDFILQGIHTNVCIYVSVCKEERKKKEKVVDIF